jgi:hypothetical protein
MAIAPSPTAETTRLTEPCLITVLEGFIRALDFYSHVLPDMQREAVDRLDMMLS